MNILEKPESIRSQHPPLERAKEPWTFPDVVPLSEENFDIGSGGGHPTPDGHSPS